MSSNEKWTWESSPRRQFNLRSLERCYLMDSKVQIEKGEIKSEINKKKKVKRSSSPRPYWNIYRAVLAGWLIRYPSFFFKTMMLGVLFFLVLIMIIISPSEGPERPYETPREPLVGDIK